MSLDQNALDSLRIDRDRTPLAQESNRSYRWFALAAVALAVIAGLYALLRENAVEVDTITVQAAAGGRVAGAVLNASGYVVARRQATVSAKVTGKIADVLIEEGMRVKQGQLLARLDDQTHRPLLELARRQLDAARNNLNEVDVRVAEAERNVHRMQKLRTDNLVSEAQLDQAQSEFSALGARLEALRSEVKVAEGSVRVRQQELEDLLVRAPFDGVVVSKDAQPGEMISPISAGGGFTRTGVATIVDMDSREIEVDVNEAFINRVQAGQKTQAVLDAYPGWVIPSHVINIVPTADRQKATVRVRIGFDELDPRILTDMGVKVSFLEDQDDSPGQDGPGQDGQEQQDGAASRPVLRAPASAVTREGEVSYVWRVLGDRIERVAVRTAGERDGQIDLLSGVNAGDVLVSRPVAGLAEGVAVRRKGQ